MMLDGHTYINIDAQHIKASSPRLLAATVESPEDMVLLWDEAVNRLAREQTDLLEEMGLQAPEDTLQVGVTTVVMTVATFLLCFCVFILAWDRLTCYKRWACRRLRTRCRWVVLRTAV
jgi:hypothetical protein